MSAIQLQSLRQDEAGAVSANLFEKPYVQAEGMKIERSGLFHTLLNQLCDGSTAGLPHLLASRFEIFNNQKKFFRLISKNTLSLENASEVLLVFNVSPKDGSLEMLSDFLQWFKRKKTGKLSAFYHYDLDLTDSYHQVYLAGFFSLLSKELGEVPAALSYLQLEKAASLEKMLVIEAASQWKSLDNYLVHLLLSKGAAYFMFPSEDKFEVIEEHELSFSHSLQIVERSTVGYAQDENTEELKKLNLIKHPGDLKLFYYLSYKNLFKD